MFPRTRLQRGHESCICKSPIDSLFSLLPILSPDVCSRSSLSTPSLHFQLINFPFWRLSPVSSISPFLYSPLMPFLPFLLMYVIFTLSKLPLCVLTLPFPSLPEKHCVSPTIAHLTEPSKSYHTVHICLFLSLLQFCPLHSPPLHTLAPFLLQILSLFLHRAKGACNVCQCSPSEAFSASLLSLFSSFLLVLRIEV